MSPVPENPIRLAILVSGSGTTLQNLIDEIAAGRLNAKASIVVASRAGLVGTDRAVKAGIPNVVVNRKDFASVAEEGHRKYMAAGCNGCHGGGGGGGMAPPLTNPVWIYGDDDDTLFRLIALGTGKLSPGNAFGNPSIMPNEYWSC